MRSRHYPLLFVVVGLLTWPNLGTPALWDMDEGVNAECAREMMESGTWIVPTFNWELRSAKPVLLYWMQRFSYSAFGVSEFAARFPAAVLAMLTCLTVYELARRMFDALTGLLAAVVLASAIQFNLLSHAATPDAPLIFFTVVTFASVWVLHERGGRNWLIWPALPCGLAVLTKGPVGLGIPALAFVAYFLWNREWKRLFDHRLLYGGWILAAVVVPWVGFVAAETRGEWLFKFVQNENLNRMATAQENHAGPPYYYPLCLIVLFAPWSSMIGGVFWYAVKGTRRDAEQPTQPVSANRFLLCWILAYVVPFSFFATKLPNYIAPVYPALAILTARFFVQWMRREVAPRRWFWWAAVAGLSLTGVAFLVGFVILSGRIPVDIRGMRTFPGLENWAWIGLFPLTAAVVTAWAIRTDRRPLVPIAFSVAACGLIGFTAGGAALVIDDYKAAKTLVLTSGARQPDAEIRLATLTYFADSQSIVFYAERRVKVLKDADEAKVFLALPLESYLFVPEPIWNEQFAGLPYRVVARKYDYVRNAVILVVCNR